MKYEGFQHFSGYFSTSEQRLLFEEVRQVIERAPLFQPRMPRTGQPFSVQMTNAGSLGWVSDKDAGYRYQATHLETGHPFQRCC